jgi:hypothetical protein
VIAGGVWHDRVRHFVVCVIALSAISLTWRCIGGTDAGRRGWLQASITGYEVQQLRHGEWTAVVEAEQLINDQLRRIKRERRHLDSDCEEPARLRKRLLCIATYLLPICSPNCKSGT